MIGTTVTITTTHEIDRDDLGNGDVDLPNQPLSAGAVGGLHSQRGARNGSRRSDRLGLRVLVAEHDPVDRKVVTGMLAKLGVTPTVVTNGHDAVEAVTGAAHDGGGTYDVVLMDVEMPVMDGLCAVGRIRHDLGSAPSDGPLASDHRLLPREGHDRLPWFIALTANALSGDRERFLEGGMDDYLAKPFTLQALEAALDRSRTVPA